MDDPVIIGDATLYCADCREVLPLLQCFDLILTDPPYGINEAAGKNKSRVGLASGKDYGNDSWDKETTPSWVIELMGYKSQWQIMFGGNYYNLPPTSCWLIWDKVNGKTDFADFELAWTNLQKSSRLIRWKWNGMLQQDMSNKEHRYHPTQKPVPVMIWCLTQVPSAQTVCDPFMGSGTTGVACARMGKTFTGIERERKYFEIACRRIEDAHRQAKLFPDDGHDSVDRLEHAQGGLL